MSTGIAVWSMGVICLGVMWLISHLYHLLLDAYERSATLSDIEYSWFFRLLLNLVGYSTVLVPMFILYKYLEKINYFDKLSNSGPTYRVLFACFGEPGERLPEAAKRKEDTPAREGVELAFCFTGLMAAYLVWGLLQEKIMTQSYVMSDGSTLRFSDSQFLVFVNRLAALLVAGARLLCTRAALTPTPLYKFSYCSLTNVLSAWCQYEALKYVSFPTQVNSTFIFASAISSKGPPEGLMTLKGQWREQCLEVSCRVDCLEARIEALENKQCVALPDNKVSQLEHIVGQLQLDLNDREQDLLSADLEISNIPDIPGENVVHTVGLVAAKLGVALEERDIVFAQRVGLRVEREPAAGAGSPAGAATAAARGRRIVVRLTRRAVRDELLQGARVRRGATTADFGLSSPPRRFFLNERLTRTNKHLFYRVREAGGRLGWRYTWTKNGRILAKQGDGKPTHCIRTMEDLSRVFGQDVCAEKIV